MQKKHLTRFNTLSALKKKKSNNTEQSGNRRKFPKHNVIYEKPIANSILNGERLKLFLLRSRTRQGSGSCHFYSILN
jgi:hypothetical protein